MDGNVSSSSSTAPEGLNLRNPTTITIDTASVPPEVYSMILSHLDPPDLLNYRLVSQSWNQECLTQLRKSSLKQVLTHHNIHQYIEFATERNAKNFVVPFHLNVDVQKWSTEIDQNGHAFDINQKLKNVIEQVESLLTLFGPQCVHSLTLDSAIETFPAFKTLIALLAKVSPTVKVLDMAILQLNYLAEAANIMMENPEFVFQNLVTVKCKYSFVTRPGFTCGPGFFSIFSYILQNSPNLKNLELPEDFQAYSSIPFSTLKAFKMRIVKRKEEELNGLIDALQTAIAPRNIKKVHFKVDHNIYLEPILALLSNTLTSLTLEVNDFSGFRFPELPHLRTLRLNYKVHYRRSYINADTQQINFNPESFPSLESVDISSEICFNSKSLDLVGGLCPQRKPEGDTRFPTVQYLKLRVGHSNLTDLDIVEGLARIKKNLKKILETFPRVTRVAIVNECPVSQFQFAKCLLIELIQSQESALVKTLELHNFESRSLGHILRSIDHRPYIKIGNVPYARELKYDLIRVLEKYTGDLLGIEESVSESVQNDDLNGNSNCFQEFKSVLVSGGSCLNSFKMKNVKKIRIIETIVKTKSRDLDQSSKLPIWQRLYMPLILQHFEQLGQLDVSSSMLCSPNSSADIQEFRTKYPNLAINLIDSTLQCGSEDDGDFEGE